MVQGLGRERALDLELCGGSVQQPQLFPVHRYSRDDACCPLVAAAGSDAIADHARGTRQEGAELSRAGDRATGRRRAAALDHGLATLGAGGTVDHVNGDHLLLAPPLILTDAQADLIATGLHDAITDVLAQIG
mgnify:CR=1 FL=1